MMFVNELSYWQGTMEHREQSEDHPISDRTYQLHNLFDCGWINSVKVVRLYQSLANNRFSGIWIISAGWLAERHEQPDSQHADFAKMRRSFLVRNAQKGMR